MASDRDPFLNPFTDPDRRAIWDMLVPRDIDAFVSADWDAVAGDFVAANFTGISGNFQPDPQARYEVVDRTLAVIKRSNVSKLGFIGNEQYRNDF